MEKKLVTGMKWISKGIVYALLGLVLSCMLFGTAHIFVILVQSITISKNDYSIIDINHIYSIFSLILVILVGHELFNAILHIIDNKKMPVREILQIAMIALGNKIITLDVGSVGMNLLIGLGVVVFSLGLSYFFFTARGKAARAKIVEDNGGSPG